MKPQDIVFLFIFLLLVFLRKRKISLFVGLFLFLAAIPLFAFWIFFTAERLVWYAIVFILLSLILKE